MSNDTTNENLGVGIRIPEEHCVRPTKWRVKRGIEENDTEESECSRLPVRQCQSKMPQVARNYERVYGRRERVCIVDLSVRRDYETWRFHETATAELFDLASLNQGLSDL